VNFTELGKEDTHDGTIRVPALHVFSRVEEASTEVIFWAISVDPHEERSNSKTSGGLLDLELLTASL
jgi:hypothetical protein